MGSTRCRTAAGPSKARIRGSRGRRGRRGSHARPCPWYTCETSGARVMVAESASAGSSRAGKHLFGFDARGLHDGGAQGTRPFQDRNLGTWRASLWPCLPAREAARQLHESASNFAGARPAPRRSAVTHETDRTAHVLLSTAGHHHHGRRPGRLLQAARRAEECDEQRDPPGIPSEGAREPPRPRGRARALPDDQQGRFALSRPFLCEVLVVPLTRQRR